MLKGFKINQISTLIITTAIGVFTSSLARANILELIKMYVDFETNNVVQFHSDPLFENLRETVDREAYAKNLKSVQDLYALAEKKIDGKVSANHLLKEFFEYRFELLDSRVVGKAQYDADLRQKVKARTKLSYSFIPTDPVELDILKTVSPHFAKSSSVREWNLRSAKSMTDRYQMMNRIIRELIEEIGLANLSPDNKTWVQCSVTLHPFLSGKTEDPGFPDEACIRSPRTRLPHLDYDICSYYIWPVLKVTMHDLTLGARGKITVLLSAREYYDLLEHTGQLTPEIISKAANRPNLPPLDFLIQDPETESSETKAPIPSRKRKKKHTPTRVSRPYLEKGENTGPPTDKLTCEPAPSVVENEDKAVPFDPNPIEAPRAQLLHEEPAPDQDPVPALRPKLLPCHKPASPVKRPHQSVAHLEPAPAPRGLRIFHSEAALTPQDPIALVDLTRLSRKDRNWLDDLFNHRLNEVYYSDFKRIWERLNGEKSIIPVGSGSSHHKLLNATGGWAGSIFTHGKKQSYSGEYLQYLRAPFEMVGINKNILD